MNPYNDKVYVTYNNDGKISGIYANNIIAKEERDKRGDREEIDSFELEGDRKIYFNDEVYEYCRYWNPHLNTIRVLIHTVFDIKGCAQGGLLHPIIFREKYENYDINKVLNLCDEHSEREEAGLVKLICQELLKLKIEERTLLLYSYILTEVCGEFDCSCCSLSTLPIKGGIK